MNNGETKDREIIEGSECGERIKESSCDNNREKNKLIKRSRFCLFKSGGVLIIYSFLLDLCFFIYSTRFRFFNLLT